MISLHEFCFLFLYSLSFYPKCDHIKNHAFFIGFVFQYVLFISFYVDIYLLKSSFEELQMEHWDTLHRKFLLLISFSFYFTFVLHFLFSLLSLSIVDTGMYQCTLYIDKLKGNTSPRVIIRKNARNMNAFLWFYFK